MKVLPIQQQIFSNCKLRECDPKTGTCEPEAEKNITKSIYSKGLTGIAFNGVISPKTVSQFEREIAEQPFVLRNLSNKYFNKVGKINMDLNMTQKEVSDIKRIYILASGSSKNAAEMAQNYMESVAGVPVIVKSASAFIQKRTPMNSKEDLAILVSQSGNTADTHKALELVKEGGVKTIAITNNNNSKIAKDSDFHLPLEAGEEKAVAATKTVTSSIYNLMVLGTKLMEIKRGNILYVMKAYNEFFQEAPMAVAKTLAVKDDDLTKVAKVIADSDNIYLYSNYNNVGAVREGALKLTETTGKRVIADTSGEALHGTFASIKPDDPVIHVITEEFNTPTYNISVNNMSEIVRKRNTKHPIVLTNDNELNLANNVLKLSVSKENQNFMPLLTTVKMQQLTNEVTKLLGINPDNGGGFLTKYRQNMSM